MDARALSTPTEDALGATSSATASPDQGLPIRLALSGGGVRAATFHAGVLRRLAVDDLLERVTHVSTVSGGSLLVAAAMSANGLSWRVAALKSGQRCTGSYIRERYGAAIGSGSDPLAAIRPLCSTVKPPRM